MDLIENLLQRLCCREFNDLDSCAVKRTDQRDPQTGVGSAKVRFSLQIPLTRWPTRPDWQMLTAWGRSGQAAVRWKLVS